MECRLEETSNSQDILVPGMLNLQPAAACEYVQLIDEQTMTNAGNASHHYLGVSKTSPPPGLGPTYKDCKVPGCTAGSSSVCHSGWRMLQGDVA